MKKTDVKKVYHLFEYYESGDKTDKFIGDDDGGKPLIYSYKDGYIMVNDTEITDVYTSSWIASTSIKLYEPKFETLLELKNYISDRISECNKKHRNEYDKDDICNIVIDIELEVLRSIIDKI